MEILMKEKIIICILFVCSFTVFFTGCESTKFSKSYINGLVYTYESEAIPDAQVFIDDKITAYSDLFGHFNIHKSFSPENKYKLTIKKKGYITYEEDVFFNSNVKVLYVQLQSIETELDKELDEMCELILNKNYSKAKPILLKLKESYPDNTEINYLLSSIFFTEEMYTEAKELICLSPNADETNVYISNLFSLIENKLHEKEVSE